MKGEVGGEKKAEPHYKKEKQKEEIVLKKGYVLGRKVEYGNQRLGI